MILRYMYISLRERFFFSLSLFVIFLVALFFNIISPRTKRLIRLSARAWRCIAGSRYLRRQSTSESANSATSRCKWYSFSHTLLVIKHIQFTIFAEIEASGDLFGLVRDAQPPAVADLFAHSGSPGLAHANHQSDGTYSYCLSLFFFFFFVL